MYIQAIASWLSSSGAPHLHTLSLHVEDGHIDGLNIFKALEEGKVAPKLQRLHLTNCDLSDEGIDTFVSMIGQEGGGGIGSLLDLQLSPHCLDDGGLVRVVEAVVEKGAWRSMKDLNLSYDQEGIGYEGMKALAQALAKGAFPHLESLTLRCTFKERTTTTATSGFSLLMNAFSTRSSTLTHLDILPWPTGSVLPAHDVKALSESMALGGLPRLKYLSLPVDEEGMSVLAQALQAGAGKECLEEIWLTVAWTSSAMKKEAEEALGR